MNKARGFTLIEMLVVISILGVLISLVVVGAIAAREQARKKRVLSFAGQVERVLAADCAVITDLDDDPADGAEDRCGEGAAPILNFLGFDPPVQTQGILNKDNTAYHFDTAAAPIGEKLIIWSNVAPVGKSWTMQAWVKPDDITGLQQLKPVVFVDASNGYFFYLFQRREDIIAQIDKGDGSTLDLSGLNVLINDEWTHILFSYDGIAQMAYLYINDELVESKSTVGFDYDVTNEMLIGVGGPGAAAYLGAVDNVRIYAETVGSGF